MKKKRRRKSETNVREEKDSLGENYIEKKTACSRGLRETSGEGEMELYRAERPSWGGKRGKEGCGEKKRRGGREKGGHKSNSAEVKGAPPYRRIHASYLKDKTNH